MNGSVIDIDLRLLKQPNPCSTQSFGSLRVHWHATEFPTLRIVESTQRVVLWMGCPLYQGRSGSFENILSTSPLESIDFKSFHGTFLFFIYEKSAQRLFVANDRFASFPVYFRKAKDHFMIALNYEHCWDLALQEGQRRIHAESFFELIALQRLLGSKTYDRDSFFLEYASLLQFGNKDASVRVHRYWTPDFRKTKNRTLNEWSQELADTLRLAVNEYTSEDKRYGLLLSGGLDSRLVLAATTKPVTCLTVGSTFNNECRVARQVALARGQSHVYLERDLDHYASIYPKATELSSGLNVFDHAHFLNFEGKIKPLADVLLHGYALDFLFQGKYLPARSISTFFKKLAPLKQNLPALFAQSISYRLKSIAPLELVKPALKEQMRAALLSSIHKTMDEASALSDDPYDIWEYAHTHNISRHYSALFLISIRTFMEERTVAFHKAVYDLFHAMPASIRFNAVVFKQAIRILSPTLMEIDNANTNMRADYSPLQQSVVSVGRRALKSLGLGAQQLLPPMPEDRSWPDRNRATRPEGNLSFLGEQILKDESLETLGFLDMDQVRSRVQAHREGRAAHADLIISLASLRPLLSGQSLVEAS